MLRGILIPRELVNEALKTTAAALHGQETKFFAYRGRVMQQVDVPNYGVQLTAADQIYSLAGLYSREREAFVGMPTVALEVDPHTGVVRLIVNSQVELSSQAEHPNTLAPELPTEASAAEALVEAPALPTVTPRGARSRVPDEVWKLVLDEEAD